MQVIPSQAMCCTPFFPVLSRFKFIRNDQFEQGSLPGPRVIQAITKRMEMELGNYLPRLDAMSMVQGLSTKAVKLRNG